MSREQEEDSIGSRVDGDDVVLEMEVSASSPLGSRLRFGFRFVFSTLMAPISNLIFLPHFLYRHSRYPDNES